MQDARGENQSRGRKLIFIYLFFYFHHVIHFQWAHVTGQMDLWSRCQLLKIRFREEEEKKRKEKKRDPALRFRSRLYANVSPCTCEVCEACVSVWLRAGSASAAAAVWTLRSAAQRGAGLVNACGLLQACSRGLALTFSALLMSTCRAVFVHK